MKQKRSGGSERTAPERDLETCKREIGTWYSRYEKESAWLTSATARVNDFIQRQSIIDQEYKALKDFFRTWMEEKETITLHIQKEAGHGTLFFATLEKFVGFAESSAKSQSPAVREGIAVAKRLITSWDGMDMEAEKEDAASGAAAAISPEDSAKILKMLEEMGCPEAVL